MQKLIISLLSFLLLLNVKAQTDKDNFIPINDVERQYGQKYKNSFLVFAEQRENPIKWDDSLNINWLKNNYSDNPYILNAQPGEYFVFQLGVWATGKDLQNIQVHFSNLKNNNDKIIVSQKLTCFNTGGINYEGKPFIKHI